MNGETLPLVWLSFEIIGKESFDLAEVTAKLGIEPTSQQHAGDAVDGGRGIRHDDRWQITVGPSQTLEIETMLDELLALLLPVQDSLVSVYREFDAEARLICAVEPTSALAPVISFPPHVVRWAATHHVELDVDLMICRAR
jgi:Domain of unknown function (DUF4279)